MTISAFSGRPRTVINIRLNKRETSPSKPHIHILHSGRKCGSYFQRQRKITITFYVRVLLEECNGRGWPQSADSLSPYVQRWAKRWTCFAMQQPGRGRQNFLATIGPPFNPSLYTSFMRPTGNPTSKVALDNLSYRQT